MARLPTPPAKVTAELMDSVARLVKNLLIENPNLKPGADGRSYHGRNTPATDLFVHKELRPLAEAILERVFEVKEVVVDLAADAEVPGLTRSQKGRIHDMDVCLSPAKGDAWRVSITDPHGFSDKDDFEAIVESEAAAIAAARAFAKTGEIPEALLQAAVSPAP